MWGALGAVIEPGDVYEVPPRLARPPQAAHQPAPPHRDSRWVLVVSSQVVCAHARTPDVMVVLLSGQVDHAGENDVMVYRGEGGVQRDSIAQGDIIFTIAKQDLPIEKWRGRVQTDTLIQVRAVLARVLGLV